MPELGNFSERKIITLGIGIWFMWCRLSYMCNYSGHNDNHKYNEKILFLKCVWLNTLKNKTGINISNAFKEMKNRWV